MSDGFSLTKQSEVFKTNYDNKSATLYNSSNVLDGRIVKRYDFTGSDRSRLTHLSFSGGVGSGRLPKTNSAKYKQARIYAKKMYATVELEREAIHASANDKGAFLRATQETVKKGVQSFNRNSQRALWGKGDGVLGAGYANADGDEANVAGNGAEATPYVVQISARFWKEANWEEMDYVQMVVAGSPEGADTDTNLLLVQAVDPDTRKISLVGTSARLAALTGAGPLAATDEIAMQRSYNTDPMGLAGVLEFSQTGVNPVDGSSSLYEVPFQRRWKMDYKDMSGAGVTVDAINGRLLAVDKKTGETPNMIMTSYNQYQHLLALLEDHKRYVIGNRNVKQGKELMGKYSFSGVQFMSTKGPVPIFIDRFCDDDKIWMINENYIERHHRPGFGWFTEDKTVFLRLNDDDAYGARYGGYYENYFVPTFHSCLYGLATA